MIHRTSRENDGGHAKATIQDFLRGRAGRQENREIVRDLLRGVGVGAMTAAARKDGIAAALSGFGDSPERFDPDPGRYAEAFSRLLGADAERASRPGPPIEWQTSGFENPLTADRR